MLRSLLILVLTSAWLLAEGTTGFKIDLDRRDVKVIIADTELADAMKQVIEFQKFMENPHQRKIEIPIPPPIHKRDKSSVPKGKRNLPSEK